VPHLTYVGDADIGEHSNIGASSVFVNYDGETKRRTMIGSHVRTGSDTMFVAPRGGANGQRSQRRPESRGRQNDVSRSVSVLVLATRPRASSCDTYD
jgi:bifunctional UDP-N-acetylglucosamine pyrophosphorylase/glucosamine-1-phosphate N-acetyltransferase